MKVFHKIGLFLKDGFPYLPIIAQKSSHIFCKSLRIFLRYFLHCIKKYLQLFLQNAKNLGKNIANICSIFTQYKKYRKYLRYFLRSAKITAKNRKIMGEKIWLPQIFAIFFAERKNYRKYQRYFLQSAKNTAKNIAKKTGAKIWPPQIFAIFFAERKNYRKYLRYFLQSAKYTAKNIAK